MFSSRFFVLVQKIGHQNMDPQMKFLVYIFERDKAHIALQHCHVTLHKAIIETTATYEEVMENCQDIVNRHIAFLRH